MSKVLYNFGLEDYKPAVTLINIGSSSLTSTLKEYLVLFKDVKKY